MKISLTNIARQIMLCMVAVMFLFGNIAPAFAQDGSFNILKWEKSKCDKHRADWPEGRNLGKDRGSVSRSTVSKVELR